jgi:hypothetical protein
VPDTIEVAQKSVHLVQPDSGLKRVRQNAQAAQLGLIPAITCPARTVNLVSIPSKIRESVNSAVWELSRRRGRRSALFVKVALTPITRIMSASHALSIIILLVSPMSASWPCVPERFNLICGWSEVTEIVLHYSSLDPQQLINAETHKLPNEEPIANIDRVELRLCTAHSS